MRRLPLAATGVAAVLVLTTGSTAPAGADPVNSLSTDSIPVLTVGRFAPYAEGAKAVTHDPKLVPVGAGVTVAATHVRRGGTLVLLGVRGLVPGRTYGAHAHTKPCGAAPADSGPHYQSVLDPVQPSVDPKYANASNEIWLDFTTNRHGVALSKTVVPWHFGERRAKSVVIHFEKTSTHQGHAGTAGARLACVNVDF
ncbi:MULTISPECIES: superoxide dismutase [unclassified Crossiella]|uniref:superoxide dismutase n=1 Tax=unclassified Crossiella TaxID=2620835 RepID=UPI001FFFFBAF|nr:MULTISPECIES: superoxide dismutase [unclassified Crossiella]MCK2236581.1 superoxide dismutase [Crossiella sp. S99.2]MCK2250248.1 superoxide dismutase [Crossiella sp. S99.1]